MKDRYVFDRIRLAISEDRLDHNLSHCQLAALSGVSATTIRKLERGGVVDPALVVQLGATLAMLDAYRPPRFEDDVDVLLQQATQTVLGEEEGTWAA